MFSTLWNSASLSAVGTASAPKSERAFSMRPRELGDPGLRRVHQQHLVALPLRKHGAEVGLGHQQLALKHAVPQRRHDPQPDRTATARDLDLFAESAVEHVVHRGDVGDHWNGAVRRRLLEKTPWIGPAGRVCRERSVERESAGLHELGRSAKNSRLLRLIEVQTARVIPRAQTESRDRRVAEAREIQRLPAGRCRRVVHDRQQRLDDELVATCAGCRIVPRPLDPF